MAGETREFKAKSSLSTHKRLLNIFEGMERLGYLSENGKVELTRLRESG